MITHYTISFLYISLFSHARSIPSYTIIVTHTPFSYSFTLCWSAMLRPAHISFTIRFHKSVSVFKLASNTSFRPRTRSFRLGIRRSRKGAEDTFTSYREKTGSRSLCRINSWCSDGIYLQFSSPDWKHFKRSFGSPLNLGTVPPPRNPVGRRSTGRAVAESWRSSPHRGSSWQRRTPWRCTRWAQCAPGQMLAGTPENRIETGQSGRSFQQYGSLLALI